MKRNRAARGRQRSGRRAAAAALVLLLLTIAGCGSRAQLNLDPGGSGTGEIVVDLDPVFVAYYRDLAGAVGGDADVPLFDLNALSARFRQEEALTLRGVRSPAQGRLELSVSFEDLAALAEDSRFGRLVDYTTDGERGTTVSIRITPEDIPFLLSLSGMEEGSPVELLLPPPGGEMSSEEYREYLIWALEEYESPRRLRQILDGAAVTVTVTTPEPIESVLNGGQLGPNEARFRIALLPLLTGEQEGVYELSY